MATVSAKQQWLYGSADEDQRHFDNLIRVDKTQYKPGEKQTAIHMDLARTKSIRGGLGSGKSRCVGEHFYNLGLRYPKSRYLIGRRDLPSLKKTTQHEFLEKVVDPATVLSFNVNDNILFLKNMSEFHFVQLKDPDAFKSFEGVGAFLDEFDENAEDCEPVWNKINQRLRQKIWDGSKWIEPAFTSALVFNPTDDQHPLYHLTKRAGDLDLSEFRLSTYDNLANLPSSYLPELLRTLPPWDIPRLVHGHWGRQIKGKPVFHGFKMETHVRKLDFDDRFPLLRGWDFGFNRPAVTFLQYEPITGRVHLLREYIGDKEYLDKTVVPKVLEITRQLCGSGHPVMDYCDPHGADNKDNAESSVETLRTKFGIHCIYRRERIKVGIEEIQHKIITQCPTDFEKPAESMAPLLLVDPSCQISIGGFVGGYHRDPETGDPVKDGYFDHPMDTIRYVLVHNMNIHLARQRAMMKKKYLPRNSVTGY